MKFNIYKKQNFIKSDYWNEIKPSGKLPSNRINASLSIYNEKVYLYGGTEIEGNPSDYQEFLYFNYKKGEKKLSWQKVEQKNPEQGPGQLIRHTANVIGDNLYIFGGKKNMMQNINTLYIFDLIENQWSSIDNQDVIPCLDSHSSSVWYPDGVETDQVNVHIIIYGGFNITGYQKDIYQFSIKDKKWQIITPDQSSIIPESRSNHSASIIKNTMYVFGGSHNNEKLNELLSFQLDTRIWQVIKVKNAPSVRTGHTMNSYQDKLIIFGGLKSLMNEQNDLHVFDTTKQMWKTIEQFTDFSDINTTPKQSLNAIQSKKNSVKTKVKKIVQPKPSAYLPVARLNRQYIPTLTSSQNQDQIYQSLNFEQSYKDQNTQRQQNSIDHFGLGDSQKQQYIKSDYRRPKSNVSGTLQKSFSQDINFQNFRDTTLNNYDLNKFFLSKLDNHKSKQDGLNTLYGKMRKIKISPLLDETDKKIQLKNTKKQIMLQEFNAIQVKENDEENKIIQSMKQAIKSVQQKQSINDSIFKYNDQKTVMKITSIVDSDQHRIMNKKPMPRDGHASCIVDGILLIFGGDRHRLTFSDLYELDVCGSLHANNLCSNEDKIPLIFVGKDGKEQQVFAKKGQNILEIAHHNEIDLEGACEMSLACSTCHVILPEDIYDEIEQPEEEEEDLLDLAFGLTPTSRLGCQVKIDESFTNQKIVLPKATRNFYVDGHKPQPH